MCKCCASQLACCCGPEPCGLCCPCLPDIKQSLGTRIMYTIYLLMATIVSCLMLDVQVQKFMQTHIPQFNSTCVALQAGDNCNKLVGYIAVYRISLVMVVFHFTLFIFTLCIATGDGCRAGVHNGYWFIKTCVLAGMCVAAFYIPETDLFLTVWMYIGMIGGAIFIIVQLYLLVDFAHRWNSKWSGLAESSHRAWNCALYFFATLFLIICGVAVVLLVLYYTRAKDCWENEVFIGVNTALCVIICFLAAVPCTKRLNQNTGILPGAIISVYVMYLTWTALVSEPPKNDGNGQLNESSSFMGFSTINTYMSLESSNMTKLEVCGPFALGASSVWSQLSGYVGAVLMIVLALYGSLRMSKKADRFGIQPTVHRDYCCCCCVSTKIQNPSDRGGQKVHYDESDHVAYSYSFFHFIFAVASLYIMMQLTMWYNPKGSMLKTFGLNWPSVWVKMVSSWVCILVYIITLFLPRRCLPGGGDSFDSKGSTSRGMLV